MQNDDLVAQKTMGYGRLCVVRVWVKRGSTVAYYVIVSEMIDLTWDNSSCRVSASGSEALGMET